MAMKMERPAWTICFGVLWLIIFAAVIIMHLALIKVVPSIQDFPTNLQDGFEEILGLEEMQSLAKKVKTNSEDALQKCSLLSGICSTIESNPSAAGPFCSSTTVDPTSERDGIKGAFDDGLSKLQKIGNDKYLGTSDMEAASDEVDAMMAELDGITSTEDCCTVAGAFCVTWRSGDELEKQYSTVKDGVDSFTSGEAIDTFNRYAGNLKYLHALPWVLVLSSLAFVVMWMKNGACCCCKNGSLVQAIGLSLPQGLLWLISFLIMTVFAAVGYAFEFYVLEQEVGDDFKGDPTVGDLLVHFQTEFPEFWDIVFADMESGLALFRISASIFVIVCLFIAVYSCCFCCLRPYSTEPVADS